jgi:hypothetical protein
MIKKSPILKDVIKANPELYDFEETAEAKMNILALWVYFERSKGEKSFFHPFFAVVEHSYSILDWTVDDLAMLKDEYFLARAKYFQSAMEDHWA